MKTFLTVDDSSVVRKVARQILEDLGFYVAEAEDGQKALDYCREKGMPDGILLDWNMPIMSGIEFLEVLRKEPEGQTPVVLFCTTENDLSFIQKALVTGANEYIMKPFDGEIIKNKLIQVGLYQEE